MIPRQLFVAAATLVMSLILSPRAFSQAVAVDDSDVRPPVTKSDIQIVRRARQILDAPAKWNRQDNRICPSGGENVRVARTLEILREDLNRTLRLLGCAAITALDDSYVDRSAIRNTERA